MSSRRVALICGALLLSAVLLTYLWRAADLQSVRIDTLYAGIEFRHVALFIIAVAANLFLSGERWLVIARAAAQPAERLLRRRYLFLCTAIGGLFGQVMPFQASMAMARGLGLRLQRRSGFAKGAAHTIYEYVFDIFFLLSLAVPGYLVVTGALEAEWALYALSAAILLAAVIGALLLDLMYRTGGRFVSREHASRLPPWIAELFATWVPRLRPGQIHLLSLLSLLRFAASVASVLVLASALQFDVRAWQVMISLPLAQLTVLIPITPGGLGVLEWTWASSMHMMGVSFTQAAAFVLVLRVFSILALIAITAVAAVIYALTPLEPGTPEATGKG